MSVFGPLAIGVYLVLSGVWEVNHGSAGWAFVKGLVAGLLLCQSLYHATAVPKF